MEVVSFGFFNRRYYWLDERENELNLLTPEKALVCGISYTPNGGSVHVNKAFIEINDKKAYYFLFKRFVKMNKEKRVDGDLYSSDPGFDIMKKYWENNGFNVNSCGVQANRQKYIFRNY